MDGLSRSLPRITPLPIGTCHGRLRDFGSEPNKNNLPLQLLMYNLGIVQGTGV